MSRRRPSRSRHLRESTKPPDRRPHEASWAGTLLIAASAALFGIITYAQLTSPTSMLSAITRLDMRRLNTPAAPGAAAHPTWDDVAASRDAAIRALPSAGAHFALGRLLELVVDVHRGRRPAHAGVTEAGPLLRQDNANLVARLAYATLVDLQGHAPDKPAIERFEALRSIVDGEPPTKVATLYNSDFTHAFHEVLTGYVRRPDVAAAMARSVPHGLILEHYAALPMIYQRLEDLEADLGAAGHADAAQRCNRWMARAASGLIASEADAGTRLLCVELLAELCRRSTTNPSAVERLRRLRADFHAHAQAAPMDLCDQDLTPQPAVAVSAYNAAFGRLAFAGALIMIALGAAALFVLVSLASLVQAALRRASAPAAEERRCPVYVKPAIALLPACSAALLILATLRTSGVDSQTWVAFLAADCITTGALLAIALAGVITVTNTASARVRLAGSALIALAFVLLAAIPPQAVTQAHRWSDRISGTAWIFALLPITVVVWLVWLSPARLRTIASAAAIVSCLNIAAGFACLQAHRAADNHYQQTAATARLDEFSARLGPDWHQQYLAPAQQALGLSPD